jgi:predicted transcriptional regulator
MKVLRLKMLAKVSVTNQKSSTELPSKYRSRADIVAAILRVVSERGASKTRIMYRAFLSSSQLKQYIRILLDNGLLATSEERSIYKITENGMRLLQLYHQLTEMMNKGNPVIGFMSERIND